MLHVSIFLGIYAIQLQEHDEIAKIAVIALHN